LKEEGNIKLTNAQQLDEITLWFQNAIKDSLGTKSASLYADKFKTQTQQLLINKKLTAEEAFLKVYESFYKKILGPLVCGWVVMVLKTFEIIKKEIDPNVKVWWLARDAYPGLWAAELIEKSLRDDSFINQLVHINRSNLGIKNETDVSHNSLVSDKVEDYLNLTKYIRQQIGSAKIIIFADSLQYAYMVDVLNKGRKSFIINRINGIGIWKTNQIPRVIENGFLPPNVKLLPIVFYSHLCEAEFGNSVPSYLNYLAKEAGYNLSLDRPIRLKLEALADALEATICIHKSVTNFIKDKKGILTPKIYMRKNILYKKFVKAAERGIKQAIYEWMPIIEKKDWNLFFQRQIKSLNNILNKFNNKNSLLINTTAPIFSKREELFQYVLRLRKEGRDWLGTKKLICYLFKPVVK